MKKYVITVDESDEEKSITVPATIIPTPKPGNKFDLNLFVHSCKWWQYIPESEQNNTKFWDILLQDGDVIEVNLDVSFASAKCTYDAAYFRFHNCTFRIPPGRELYSTGVFWLYMDGKPMLNPSIPQYFAAPAYNIQNPDAVWGSATHILADGNSIKTGLTKYQFVYRGRYPFNPKSFELHVVNGQSNVC